MGTVVHERLECPGFALPVLGHLSGSLKATLSLLSVF